MKASATCGTRAGAFHNGRRASKVFPTSETQKRPPESLGPQGFYTRSRAHEDDGLLHPATTSKDLLCDVIVTTCCIKEPLSSCSTS